MGQLAISKLYAKYGSGKLTAIIISPPTRLDAKRAGEAGKRGDRECRKEDIERYIKILKEQNYGA